eukprot:scaffold18311_cov54-Attheya_sp.AAC.2
MKARNHIQRSHQKKVKWLMMNKEEGNNQHKKMWQNFDVEKVQNDEETAKLLLDCLKGVLLGHDAEISPSEVIRILKGLGETKFSNAPNEARKKCSTHKKKLVDYLESHHVLQPYWFKPLIVLKYLAQALDADLAHGSTSLRNHALQDNIICFSLAPRNSFSSSD